MNSTKSKFFSVFLIGLISMFCYSAVLAADTSKPTEDQTSTSPLILPADEDKNAEKKCITVCQKFGESCFINPRTGNRKCRRTCKEFGKECL